jgi:hypothetical protein
MKTIPLLIVCSLIIVLFIGLFYWFQWRPANARRECAHYADIWATAGIDQNASNSEQVSTRAKDYDLAFKTCMQTEGLNP